MKQGRRTPQLQGQEELSWQGAGGRTWGQKVREGPAELSVCLPPLCSVPRLGAALGEARGAALSRARVSQACPPVPSWWQLRETLWERQRSWLACSRGSLAGGRCGLCPSGKKGYSGSMVGFRELPTGPAPRPPSWPPAKPCGLASVLESFCHTRWKTSSPCLTQATCRPSSGALPSAVLPVVIRQQSPPSPRPGGSSWERCFPTCLVVAASVNGDEPVGDGGDFSAHQVRCTKGGTYSNFFMLL